MVTPRPRKNVNRFALRVAWKSDDGEIVRQIEWIDRIGDHYSLEFSAHQDVAACISNSMA
jgi:hypothetical protein